MTERISLAEYRQRVGLDAPPPAPTPQPAANKYGAVKTPCRHGHIHDSGREARRCDQLHMLQLGGSITELEHQVFFPFVIAGRELRYAGGRRVGVTIDFSYRENGLRVAEDAKGHRVRDWPLRRAIFEALYPEIEVRET